MRRVLITLVLLAWILLAFTYDSRAFGDAMGRIECETTDGTVVVAEWSTDATIVARPTQAEHDAACEALNEPEVRTSSTFYVPDPVVPVHLFVDGRWVVE